jgi:hypothetical protein
LITPIKKQEINDMGAKKLTNPLKLVQDSTANTLKEQASPGPSEVVVKENPVITKLKQDFKRFTQLLQKNPMDAVMLLKKWINEMSVESIRALKAVSQQLSEDELFPIFSKLSESERESWKANVDGFLKGEELVIANKFISEEVVRDSIAPQGVSDLELIDLLLSLDQEVAVNFVKLYKNDAAVLLNLLRPKIAAKILDKLEMEESKDLISRSLVFDISAIKDNFAAFKGKLKEFVEKSKRRPFNNKILQMLPSFNPVKEKMLYAVLAQENLVTDMKRAASENFPSELVTKLPSEFLKTLLQKYDQTQRIQLLASLPDDTKQLMLATFAEEGSAAREMINLEFESLANDAVAQSRIKSQKDQLWKDFVNYVRGEIKSDEKYSSDIEMIINEWVESLCQNQKKSA